MTARDHAPGYVTNPHHTQEDWDEVSDNPELTEDQLALLRPARDVLPPAFSEAFTIGRKLGREVAPAAEQVTLHLDSRVLKYFRNTCGNWQDRINKVLLKSVGL